MKFNPLVSVIIPTYKNDGSLERAINSVLNQGYNNIEIIVVDDNNPDSDYRKTTEKLMGLYKEKDNIKYIKHNYNKNGSAARNTGFRNSQGLYISLLDDDDYFVEDKIELQVDFLEKHSEFDAVYGGRYEKNSTIIYEKEGDLTEDLLGYKILPCTCSLMLRREAYETLNGFNETYKRHQDFEFLLRFFENYKIGVIKKPLFYLQSNSVDNTLQGKDLEKLKVMFLTEFDKNIEKIDIMKSGFRRSIYAIHFSRVFWNYIKMHNWRSAFRILFRYTIKCREKLFVEIYKYAKEYFKS